MSVDQWNKRWEALEIACRKNGCSDRWGKGKGKPIKMMIEPPAEESSILLIEKQLSLKLPKSFRNIIKVYSSYVDIAWHLRDDDRKLPDEFKGIFAGEICWSLSDLPDLSRKYNEWITVCFTNPDDPYDSVWYNKFPILEVGNGDMIAIETGENLQGSVVYLSHDDGEGHGYLLGKDFEDYIDKFSLIGGVGAEDWQWLPFTSSKISGIEPSTAVAQKWREWFGLDFPN